ncbi:MAG: flagellar motor switch protein FliN/FliY, partial [bacterium]
YIEYSVMGEIDPFEEALKIAGDDSSDSQDDVFSMAMGDDSDNSSLSVAAGNDTAVASSSPEGMNIEVILDIRVRVTFEVGRTKMIISDLLSLGQGSVIELHRLVGENLDILVNGQLIATGEVVVINEKFGARIVDVIAPENRIKFLAHY